VLSGRCVRSRKSIESDPKEHALQDSQSFTLGSHVTDWHDIPKPIEKVCNLLQRRIDVLSTRTQVLENSGHDRTDCRSANILGRFFITLPHAFLDKGSEIEIVARSRALLFAACPFRPLLGDTCRRLVMSFSYTQSLARFYSEVPFSPSMKNAFQSSP